MITMIAAVNQSNTIGLKGEIPWRCREDLMHFREYTMGKVVVMGRVTWEGLPTKLPGRDVKIVSRSMQGENYVNNLEDFLKQDHSEEIVIAGGGDVYKQAMPYADKIVLSVIKDSHIEGDTFFPRIPDSFTFESVQDKGPFLLYIYKRFE